MSMITNIAFDATTTLIEELIKSITKSNRVSETGDVALLETEERIQEIENRISEYQARVAQELAIAKRIELAEEVEIEEFYDTTGSGGLGLQGGEGTFNLGLNGSGRKVVKRVYRFKGGNNVVETMSQPSESIEAE